MPTPPSPDDAGTASGGPSRGTRTGQPTEIYRTECAADCLERAFVLHAVGIASDARSQPPFHVLMVDDADAVRAREQLLLYERERSQPAPAPQLAALYPHAWVGCLVYALVLIVVGLTVANGLWGFGAFDAGTLDAGQVQAGQWWRAWTALTLHRDGEHLLGNLGGGIWFGYLAARQQGPGRAWLLITTGAALANLTEALLAAPTHRAVGASTAVFTALGLLSAYTWGTQARWAQRWALQWGPLIGGLVLLAWFGSAGEEGSGQVDVNAHMLGFAVGLLLGLLAVQPLTKRALQRLPQWAAGLIALGEIAAAWTAALHHP